MNLKELILMHLYQPIVCNLKQSLKELYQIKEAHGDMVEQDGAQEWMCIHI